MNTSRRFRSSPTDVSIADPRQGEQGYALLAVLVAVFLVLLTLSVAAPTVARSLRREREVEAVHRANQYTRAIQLYYRRFGHYPGSMEQLQKSNQIRFLRQSYPDPMTGKEDWRLIKVGENKTNVKGFFGQPLTGVASTGLGSASGMASSSGTGTPASTVGAGSSTAFGSSAGSPFGSGASPSSPLGSNSSSSGTDLSSSSGMSSGPGTPLGSTDASSGSTGSSVGAGVSSQSATGISGTNAPFLGVGLPVAGSSILTVSEKSAYPEWEFLYDPRIEQLRAKVNILGGGIGSTSAGSLGSASGLSSSSPGSATSSPASTTPDASTPAPTDPGKNPINAKPE